ncbi:MAG: phosphomannomutase/phosphoglucomutase [Phycisphaeraceae bacterium]|nr:phosphomannomutase/phosphoglucomutase [Phycisphaeraceae bacterium]
MLAKVFKAYDIRATYPRPLNEKIAWQIGWGTAELLLGEAANALDPDPMARTVVVGRDMRKSSPALSQALRQGMLDFGADVIDVGLVDTPFISFAINHLGCAGGVQTTASHNPAEYNGFKISRMKAKPVGEGSGLERIREFAALVEREKADRRGGREEKRDLWPAYREHVLRLLDPRLLDGRATLEVVIDASNGMAGTMVPKLFDGVKGLRVTRLHFDNSSGEFVHEPNPLVEANLADLRREVVKRGAAFGVCFDGDADRCMIVDETGAPIGCDLLLAWLVPGFLASAPGAGVIYDLRSSRAVPEAIRAAGGVPIESRVGHVFMKSKLAESGGIVGGELSGHFYFRDMFNTDSGARALVAVLNQALRDGRPLSKALAPLRRYHQSGEINFENENKQGALDALRRAFPKAKVTSLDGLSLDAGIWWCNVRMSNTEPLLRLNLEAADRGTVDTMVRELSRHLGRRVAH